MTTAQPDRAAAPASANDAASELDHARRVLRLEADAVAGLAETVDREFTAAVDLIESCARRGGSVLVSGLGKSGLVGAKMSATFASLGIPSHHVHPTEAAHGDLGRFNTHDVCIAISYSGETDELVSLAASLRQDGLPVISITRGGEPANSLGRVARVALAIGAVDNPDVLGVSAPAASTTATMALGDALALCASRRLGFTDAEFARRHPGGSLGGLLRPISECLRFRVGENFTPVLATSSVVEALHEAESEGRRPGALLVVEKPDGPLVGIFTDGDLRRLVSQDDTNAFRRTLGDVMTRDPDTLSADALVRDALRIVQASRRDEIPVVDSDGRPVGILDVQDLVTMRIVRRD